VNEAYKAKARKLYSPWKSGIPFFHSNLVQFVAHHSRIKLSVGGSQKLEKKSSCYNCNKWEQICCKTRCREDDDLCPQAKKNFRLHHGAIPQLFGCF
jgi:hypothetical protein